MFSREPFVWGFLRKTFVFSHSYWARDMQVLICFSCKGGLIAWLMSSTTWSSCPHWCRFHFSHGLRATKPLAGSSIDSRHHFELVWHMKSIWRVALPFSKGGGQDSVSILSTTHWRLPSNWIISDESELLPKMELALFCKMGVSENRGAPKSSILNRVFHYKPSIWGSIIFGNTQMTQASCFSTLDAILFSPPWAQPGRKIFFGGCFQPKCSDFGSPPLWSILLGWEEISNYKPYEIIPKLQWGKTSRTNLLFFHENNT